MIRTINRGRCEVCRIDALLSYICDPIISLLVKGVDVSYFRGPAPEVRVAGGIVVRINRDHRTLRFDDLEAVAHFGQGPNEKERLASIAHRDRIPGPWSGRLVCRSWRRQAPLQASRPALIRLNAWATVANKPSRSKGLRTTWTESTSAASSTGSDSRVRAVKRI
jgi:hypothetical protein